MTIILIWLTIHWLFLHKLATLSLTVRVAAFAVDVPVVVTVVVYIASFTVVEETVLAHFFGQGTVSTLEELKKKNSSLEMQLRKLPEIEKKAEEIAAKRVYYTMQDKM